MYNERVIGKENRKTPWEVAPDALLAAEQALVGALPEGQQIPLAADADITAIEEGQIGASLTPAQFRKAAAELTEKTVSENTLKSYEHALKHLDAWLGERALNDLSLAQYLVMLYAMGKSPATASQAVSAAVFRAKMIGLPKPAGERTARMLSGYRRAGKERGAGRVAGLTWRQAERAASLAADGSARGLRDAAILAVMSDGMLRGSEAAALDVRDVEFRSDGTARLRVRSSKTDPEGKGTTLFLGEQTAVRVQTLLYHQGLRPNDPLFHRIDKAGRSRGRITYQGIRLAVRKRAADAGISGRISSHSLRVGAAQSLAKRGASVVEMQHAGRWRSPNMPARYAAGEEAARGAVARLRYQQT